MNSKQLIEKFGSVYESFFGTNQIVVSMPLIVNRCDDLFPHYGGVSIKQKIPLRFYVGLTKNDSNNIRMNKISYRDNVENSFIEANVLEYAPYFYNLSDIISEKYKNLIRGGYDINIISELGRGRGLGFDTLISLAIVVALNRIIDKIDHEKIVKMNEIPINEVISNSYLGIRDILFEAYEIDLGIQGKTFFTRKISSLFDGYYPTISFTEDNFSFGNFNKIDSEYKRFAYRLDELFGGMREIPYFPIDRGLIYTGKPVLFEQIIDRNQINMDIYDYIIKDLKKTFKGLFDNLLPIKKPKFYNNFLEGKKEEITQTFGKMMGIISLEILYFMHNLYSKGYSNNDMKLFLDALDKTRFGNHITRENSNSLIGFLNKFLGNITDNRNMIAVFPNDTTIMGGSLCFVMPSEGFRKTLFDAIAETKKDFNGVDMIYASRLDGSENNGLRFDQDIEKGIFSKFLNKSSCVVKDISGGSFVCDHEECLNKCKNGLLLDIIDNKIYINGKKVTSDDLHSQSATIELLKILIENIGNDVSNKDLAVSSYSKNKNEMLGKIIIPLIELVEKELKSKLPLVCKGSIYDFYVKLNKSDIKISILDKI